MKRDMDLIRLLLLDIEGEDRPDMRTYTEAQMVYHTALLIDAKLVEGAVVEGADGFPVASHAIRLTWAGHEFLDAARNLSLWEKVKTKVKEAGATLPLPVLQELLTSFLKKQVGLE